MKKTLLLLFCFLSVSGAFAQQKALQSQYMTNPFLLNPAAAGMGKNWNLMGGFRNQWVGFEGAPKTTYLSGHGALPGKGPRRKGTHGFHGTGGFIYSDQTGPTSRTGVMVSYAYHVPLAENIYASGGVFAGLQQFRFNTDKIHLADNSNGLDPVTSSGPRNAFVPDLSLGGLVYSDRFHVGASVFQVLGNRLFRLEEANPFSRLYPHLFLSGGYNFILNKQFTLAPSLLVRYVNPAPAQADINLKGIFTLQDRPRTKHDDLLWLGISYRTKDAVVGMFGVQFLEQYTFGYSFDFTVSQMSHHSAGSHELVFGLRLK